MGNHLKDNINLKIKIFDTLNISPILLHGSKIWGIDCNEKIDKDAADLVENKFLKWLLGVSKYCNNYVCRAATGRSPMKIDAKCRNVMFWLSLIKEENKLSQITYDVKME